MVYPEIATGEPAAPLSLTASDGTGLALEALEAQAVIAGPLAFTELHLRFRNPRDRVIEGRFAITLPPNAAISRLAMQIDGRWQEAEVVELQAARRAYEDFLHRRQDPALMEKEAGNEFSARIFPIPANGVKDIIISYSQELVGSDASYTLPLRGLPVIDQVSLRVLRGTGASPMSYEATTVEHRAWKPDADFSIPAGPAGAAVQGLRAGELVVARVRPTLDATESPMTGAALLFDTSASRAVGFAHEVDRFGRLVAALAARHPGLRISVATFDQVVTPIYEGAAAGFGKGQLDAILARRPLGASNLHGALGWVATRPGLDRLIVVTDAMATAGPTGGDEIRAASAALVDIARIDLVLTGGIHDDELAARLVRGTRTRDGVVLAATSAPAELARRISQTTVSGVRVGVAGASWSWPETLDGVQPGDEALVYAALSKPSAATLAVTLSGPIAQQIKVPLAASERPLVQRAAAKAQLARLAWQRDTLAAEATDRRNELKREMIAVSTKYRVLSDFTALLVLETDADYARFGIDRTALSDILVVGPQGVAVAQRQQIVAIAAPEPDVTVPKNGDKAKPKKTAGAEDGKLAFEVADNGYNGEAQEAPAEDEKTVDLVRVGAADMDGESDDSEEGRASTTSSRLRELGPPAARRPSAPAPDPAPARGYTEESEQRIAAEPPPPEAKPAGPPALTGALAEITEMIERGELDAAVVRALAWRNEEPGDVIALVGLGQALEARGNLELAARAYGSIIDLFPSRADLRRFASQRLEHLGAAGLDLAADSIAKAVAQRPDHLTGYRQLAYAHVRAGRLAEAFSAIEAGLTSRYPRDRFPGGDRILREDLGIIGAAWSAREPARRDDIEARVQRAGSRVATAPSTRFVLSWETDANDVDFHIYDGKGGHAYYSDPKLASGGELYHDVTNGYGPECFAIDGAAQAFPYRVQIHYYSRGPMGYGMGELEILRHDGKGTLDIESRPFVAMNDSAYVELGTVEAK